MELKAGKTYKSRNGYKYYVIGFCKNGQLVCVESLDDYSVSYRFYKDGKAYRSGDSDLVEELREPVKHKRVVRFYEYIGVKTSFGYNPGTIVPYLNHIDDPLWHFDSWKLLKEIPVEYTVGE